MGKNQNPVVLFLDSAKIFVDDTYGCEVQLHKV